MQITRYQTGREFLDAVGGWLHEQESINNLMLGIAGRYFEASLMTDPAPVLVGVLKSSKPVGALVMTPPRGVVLYCPEHTALGPLVDWLLAEKIPVPECIGSNETAEQFCSLWKQHTGREYELKWSQRIFELRKVIFPTTVKGSGRLAHEHEIDLLAGWFHGFNLEALQKDDPAEARTYAEKAVAEKRLLLWADDDIPVSTAVAIRPTRRGVAIGGVYTPKEYRCQGYASACVATLCRQQLDAGREFCCLYTDLANPTSNSIYNKIGFVAVADSRLYVING